MSPQLRLIFPISQLYLLAFTFAYIYVKTTMTRRTNLILDFPKSHEVSLYLFIIYNKCNNIILSSNLFIGLFYVLLLRGFHYLFCCPIDYNHDIIYQKTRLQEPISHVRGWVNGRIAITVAILYYQTIRGYRLPSPLQDREPYWDLGLGLGLVQ